MLFVVASGAPSPPLEMVTSFACANAIAIAAGGESYFRYKQIELLPQLGPAIATALSQAKLVTIASGGENAAESTTNSITGVIQTVLAAQLVGRAGVLDGNVPALPGPTR